MDCGTMNDYEFFVFLETNYSLKELKKLYGNFIDTKVGPPPFGFRY